MSSLHIPLSLTACLCTVGGNKSMYRKPAEYDIPTHSEGWVSHPQRRYTHFPYTVILPHVPPQIQHPLRRKAALRAAEPRPGHQASEYQRQFTWKMATCGSPLLAAEQVLCFLDGLALCGSPGLTQLCRGRTSQQYCRALACDQELIILTDLAACRWRLWVTVLLETLQDEA